MNPRFAFALLLLLLGSVTGSEARIVRRPVSAECLTLRRMSLLARLGRAGLTPQQQNAVFSMRIAICVGGVVVIPQTRQWPGGATAKDVHGRWHYPNGQALYSVHREWLYPNGRAARDLLRVWHYPDGSRAMHRNPGDSWYRPGNPSRVLQLSELLTWATKRLRPEDFRVISSARHRLDPPAVTAAIIGVIWQAHLTKPRK